MALPRPIAAGNDEQQVPRRALIRSSRRQFLKAAGIGGAVVGVGGLGVVSWRAADQGVFSAGSGPAYAAWGEWDQGTGPLTLIRAAILSANPHNSQPWRFQTSASAIDLYVDPSRNTGAMDPYRREQHIGLGCALENLMIAAQAKGYDPRLTILPTSTTPEALSTMHTAWPESVQDRNEAAAVLTPNGQIFVFDSNRSGGFGSKDIWWIQYADVLAVEARAHA